MITKIWKFLLLFLWFIALIKNAEAKEIILEQELNWRHPVLGVFKKYDITLSRISYFQENTCPAFYVDFKIPPKNKDYTKAYEELLKANSNFPYALIDKKKKLLVNVGWNDHIPSKMLVHAYSDNTFYQPRCDAGSHTMSYKFIMNQNLRKNILSSPYKALMRRRDGKNLVAYLYAEKKKNEEGHDYEPSSQNATRANKPGNYYIYLYDPETDSFFPNKIAPFYGWRPFPLSTEGDFTILRSNKKNQSDILLIGKDSTEGFFELHEAYGFSEDLTTLKKYRFVQQKKNSSLFQGVIKSHKNMIYAENIFDEHGNSEIGKVEELIFYVSDIPGEIRIEPNY